MNFLKKRKSVVNNFSRLLKYINKKDYKWMGVWFVLLCIIGILPSLSVCLNKTLINSLNSLVEKSNNTVYMCVLCLVLICLIEIITDILGQINLIIYYKIERDSMHRLQSEFYEVLSRFPVDDFENHLFYKKLTMAKNGINNSGLNLVQLFADIIQYVLSIISVFAVLFYVGWTIPTAIVLCSIPTLIVLILNKQNRYNATFNLIEKRLRHDYLGSLFTDRDAVKEIKIYSCFSFLFHQWKKEDLGIRDQEIKLQMLEEKLSMLASFFVHFVMTCIMIWLVLQVAGNEITLGDYVSLGSAISILHTALGGIAGAVSDIYADNQYLSALFSMFDDSRVEEKDIEKDDSFSFRNMMVKNLSFVYPSSPENVLCNINLEIKRGDHVAIIGRNGSGKSTLAGVLMGIYEKYDGEIFINDKILCREGIKQYQKSVSSVFQNFNRYEMNVRDNIAIGNIQEVNNSKKIYEIINKVGLSKDKFRDLNTMLSPVYMSGTELSGGEWQKIALARAIIKESDLYFFDEPTAALDPKAEMNFYSNIIKLISDKTYIIISHRLGVTKYCNKIIVMDNGMIVEMGSHDELLKKQGHYYDLYIQQSGLYS